MTAGKLWTIEVTDLGNAVRVITSMTYEDINYDPTVLTASATVQVSQNLIKDSEPFVSVLATAKKASYKVERALIAADLAAHVAKTLTTHLSDAVTEIGTAGYTASLSTNA